MLCFELKAVLPVVRPYPRAFDVLAGCNCGRRSHNGHKIPLSTYLEAQNAEAAFLTMKVTRSTDPCRRSGAAPSGVSEGNMGRFQRCDWGLLHRFGLGVIAFPFNLIP